MATLQGTVALSGLPPHRGLILSLNLFPVQAADSPAPYGGDPPPEVEGDLMQVCENVDLHRESHESAVEQPFCIERPAGFYFVQVRAILVRTEDTKVFAQVEQFFFGRRPVEVANEPEGRVTFPVSWPEQSLDELQDYGTVRPQPPNKPWWQFWA
jgi:hypothetical protein